MSEEGTEKAETSLAWPVAHKAGRSAARLGWMRCLFAAFLTLAMFVALPFAELANRKPIETRRVVPVQTVALDAEVPAPPKTTSPPPEPQPDEPVEPRPELNLPRPQPIRSPSLEAAPELDVGDFRGDFALDFTLRPVASDFSAPSAPSKTGAWSLAEVDRGPSLRARAEPRYPYRARQREIEGRVELEFVVSESGHVRDARVVNAQPEGVFEDAALQAVRRWRFAAGRRNGEAVPVRVRINLRFELE